MGAQEPTNVRAQPLHDPEPSIYSQVLATAAARHLRFAVGGSLALRAYAGLLRPTKDLDLYVEPDTRHELIELVHELGFDDYYARETYDRGWIYRAYRGEAIVDIIWQMANRRAQVDGGWIESGVRIESAGFCVPLIPIEEMIWSKLYVLQRDRCDWPDILNIIDAAAHKIDWSRLLQRIGTDAVLLHSILRVYEWLRPEKVHIIPAWVWEHLMNTDVSSSDDVPRRVALLDSRPWLVSEQERMAEVNATC